MKFTLRSSNRATNVEMLTYLILVVCKLTMCLFDCLHI